MGYSLKFIILMLIPFSWVQALEISEINHLKGRKILETIELGLDTNMLIEKSFWSDSHVAVYARWGKFIPAREREELPPEKRHLFKVFDRKGNLILTLIDRIIYRVYFSEKYFCVVTYPVNEWVINLFYDYEGILRQTIETRDPGVKLSPSGEFGILTMQSLEEQSGRLEIYNVTQGRKIEIPMKLNGFGYRADFIDENRVIYFFKDDDKIRETHKQSILIQIINLKNSLVEKERSLEVDFSISVDGSFLKILKEGGKQYYWLTGYVVNNTTADASLILDHELNVKYFDIYQKYNSPHDGMLLPGDKFLLILSNSIRLTESWKNVKEFFFKETGFHGGHVRPHTNQFLYKGENVVEFFTYDIYTHTGFIYGSIDLKNFNNFRVKKDPKIKWINGNCLLYEGKLLFFE